MLHGSDASTNPAFAPIRLLAWRRAAFAVASLPACVRRSLRVQKVGRERLMLARHREGLGAASDYRLNWAHWGRRARWR